MSRHFECLKMSRHFECFIIYSWNVNENMFSFRPFCRLCCFGEECFVPIKTKQNSMKNIQFFKCKSMESINKNKKNSSKQCAVFLVVLCSRRNGSTLRCIRTLCHCLYVCIRIRSSHCTVYTVLSNTVRIIIFVQNTPDSTFLILEQGFHPIHEYLMSVLLV